MMKSRAIFISILAVTSVSYAEVRKVFPGTFFDSEISGSLMSPNLSPSEYSGMAFSHADDRFDYYRHGSALYRYYRNPEPRMSHGSSEVIPFAPALFWPGVFEFAGDEAAPARPNCSERNFNLTDYLNLVKDPSVRTKSQFLERLPKDSLQKFTFIHESKSLQRFGVSKKTPRVMRFSTDGKMILTYTTNKDARGYNDIEVMFFDDKTRRYGFVHTEFVSEDDINSARKVNTHVNPKACFSCHGGLDPRPNWQGYAKWPGMYGEVDDFMSAPEWADYKDMREHLAGTKELETLPWPAKTSRLYRTYPYTTVFKEMNYNLRPNAHFTIASSRVNALRLARKFEESPVYDKIKWSLMSFAIGCEPRYQRSNELFHEILAKGGPLVNEYSYYRLSDMKKKSDILFDVGKALQFTDLDWVLNFKEKPAKGSAMKFSTAQWSMPDFVLSVLFRDLARSYPELAPYDIRVNRMSAFFGENFMCMDEVADKLWLGRENKRKICEIIRPKKEDEIASITPADLDRFKTLQNKIWEDSYDRQELSVATIEQGRKIVTQLCAQCHQGVIPYDFKNLSFVHQPSFAANKGRLMKSIESSLGSSRQCRMPKPIAGKCLSDIERNSVLMFIDSL